MIYLAVNAIISYGSFMVTSYIIYGNISVVHKIDFRYF